MRYSSYVKLNVTLVVLVLIIISIASVAGLGLVGVGVALLFWLVGLIGLALSVAWAHRAVSEFNGAPFPGIWGVLGFNIEPDGADESQNDDMPPGGEGTPASQVGASDPNATTVPSAPPLPSELGESSSRGSSGGPAAPSARGCTACGAVTRGADSRFCRMCGARLGM